jgi:acyl-CoA thioesterase FadM
LFLRAAAAPPGDGPTSHQPSSPFFWVTIPVRESELDGYRVVNNSVYGVYLEHARSEWLAAAGLDAATAAGGGALALSHLSIRFAAPLRSGDVCRAGVRLAKATPARLICEQRVELMERRNGGGAAAGATSTTLAASLVVEATATVVSLDEAYRPRRIPAGVADALAGWDARVREGRGAAALSWDSEGA